MTAHNLLLDAFAELGDVRLWWQLATIAASLLFAWLIAYTLGKHFPRKAAPGEKSLALRRVFFPLFAFILLLIGKSVVARWLPVALINLVIPLALSLLLIRGTSEILRFAFAPSGLITLVEKTVTWIVLIGLALHLSGVHHEVLGALDEMGLTVGKQRISLLLVLEGVASMIVTVVIALWISRLIESRVMHADTLDLNLRIVLSKVTRALLILIGVLIALPLAGIDITFLSVFGGALGVGLGFGLQKTASNYISGFIILLDRSVRIGDVIAVDNKFGEITQINNRYTVLKGLDGTEAIIPNETLITSTVVNHSFTTRQVRVHLPLQISYDSPLEQAMAILCEVAAANPRVLQDPGPEAFLREFADNGLMLELVIWISDPEEGQLSLRSALNLEIWRRFQAAGIEIPYPRRDVRVLAANGPALNETPAR
ncbi:MAG: mechanosensitive ion channel [Hydrogenophilales bacterium]|nr:mechanosensitive ion channel [Hydrogenophilales bacterium]